MYGGSGQYSGVRGSGAAAPTARGHKTGGEGKRVGSVGLRLTKCQPCHCPGSVSPSWKEVGGGGGPSRPGFSRMLLAPWSTLGSAFYYYYF